MSVRRSTDKSTQSQSSRTLLEPASLIGLRYTQNQRWRQWRLTSREFSSKCSQNWRSLKPFRKVICSLCAALRSFAKFPRRHIFESIFSETGNKLLLPRMGNVCFQFYDKLNLLTDRFESHFKFSARVSHFTHRLQSSFLLSCVNYIDSKMAGN